MSYVDLAPLFDNVDWILTCFCLRRTTYDVADLSVCKNPDLRDPIEVGERFEVFPFCAIRSVNHILKTMRTKLLCTFHHA